MSTPCILEIIDKYGNKLCLYRHTDGYPQGFIPDLRRVIEAIGGPNDVEYFIANFIFIEKYNSLKRGYDWRIDIYVPVRNYEYSINYKYVMYYHDYNKAWMIEIWEYGYSEHTKIFDGTLQEAFERFIPEEWEKGCHIKEIPPKPY